ncbi:MAG: hypothetical protein ACKVHA_02900 [Fidelibacterota bacterium]|jgi:hypothetical protein|tara:strand:+ start:1486 stop:2043 length:558 start_codon:yes stop_codon:yes gene_type:complete
MTKYLIIIIIGVLLTLPLIAQNRIKTLGLEKNGEQVFIAMGEWVEVSILDSASNKISGTYLGITANTIQIKLRKNKIVKNIHLNKINSIFKGGMDKNLVSFGIKRGFLTAFTYGQIFGVAQTLIKGKKLDTSLLAGFDFFMNLSFITVPAGALTGYMSRKLIRDNTNEYVIGNQNWMFIRSENSN